MKPFGAIECGVRTLVAAVLVSHAAWADPPPSNAPLPTVHNPAASPLSDEERADPVDYRTPRYEPAGFPIIGGSTDIGLLFGAAATLSRFESGLRPYFWNMDMVLDASVKSGPSGLDVTQINLRWQWDIQGLFGGRLRLNPAAYYQSTINQGYWGLGNASIADPNLTNGRYYQFQLNEARVFQDARLVVGGPLSIAFSAIYRFMQPIAYTGQNGCACGTTAPDLTNWSGLSRLALDELTTRASGRPLVLGQSPLNIGEFAARLIYDSRDNEIMPRHGLLYQFWLRYDQAFPLGTGTQQVNYGAIGFSLAQYFAIAGPLIFASRLLADFEFGNVPFYDLFRGSTPFPQDMIGGGGAVRGVPSGRYSGPVKIVANLELRALLVGFHVFGQSFRLGANTFFDFGRVWSDYTFNNTALDGTGIGIKFGVGIGAYLRWGQAAIFRIEAAYSPDAAAENPGFPVGIYVEDGVMF